MDYPSKTIAVLKECVRASNKPLCLSSTGNSMHPFIQAGDTLHIRPASLHKLAIGDIIVYENEGMLICHRIIIPGKYLLRTKADSNFAPDPAVRQEHIVGKVVAIKKNHARGAGLIDLESPAWRLKSHLAGLLHLNKYLLWRLLKPLKYLLIRPAPNT